MPAAFPLLEKCATDLKRLGTEVIILRLLVLLDVSPVSSVARRRNTLFL